MIKYKIEGINKFMLNDQTFLEEYRTGTNNFVKDFYKKAFDESIEYWRAVGYFRSSALEAFGMTLQNFLQEGGKIKLITSVDLTEADSNAIEVGMSKKEVCEKRINDIIENEFNENIGNGVSKLAKLLEIDRLEIKIALPKTGYGIYHEKVGLFFDKEGNYIAFSGSANESTNAFENNYECIEVFTSWNDLSRAEKKKLHFETLWNETNEDCLIFDFPEAAKRNIINKVNDIYPNSSYTDFLVGSNHNRVLTLPAGLILRDFQKKAIDVWMKNYGHGIWAMATGSGKTLTALSTIEKIVNSKNANKITLLICVPSLYLLEQWCKEAKAFNLFPIKCSSDNTKWEQVLNTEITNYFSSDKYFLPIITTVDMFTKDRFQRQIRKLNNIFLVVDEVHNFGTKNIINNYDENVVFRLGLSATPQRHFDDEGTESILKYFGGIIFEYSLKDAIDNGYLSPYYYYPVLVNLTEEELEDYIIVTDKIARASIQKEDDKDNKKLTMLLIERTRIINGAENKISALVELLEERKLEKSTKNLFYCPDNKYGEIRYLDKVSDELKNIGMNVEKFTSDENQEQRTRLVKDLEDESINGLVAIKVLDEGVDIPSIERAFILASSTNPKEFVQRRGRILRKSPNKLFAELYDFIVVPEDSNGSTIDSAVHRKYLERELKRYMEFAKLSKNRIECEKLIFDLQNKYDLIHIT